MPSTLLIHPTGADAGATEVTGAITDVVAATGGGRLPLRLDGLTRAGHWTATSLPSRLNREWAGLCDSADNDVAVKDWVAPGQGRPGLTRLIGVDGLPSTVQLLQGTSVTVSGRDAVLVGLLERAQDGDRLAGRVVLQTMLPAAVRIAQGITGRPDVLGDQDEAFALVLAALWQVIATYPVASRRKKVPANLYLDTLAIVRRGHTSGTHRTLVFPEQSYADIRTAADPGQLDPGQDDPAGPADAQLCTVLAWAVRSSVLQLDEARLLARVYGLDGSPAGAGQAMAAEYALSWAALRQRCHRITRRVGQAAVAAGIDSAVQHGAVLCAA